MDQKTVRDLIEENPDLKRLMEMVIPKGDYCYIIINAEDKEQIETRVCPFWDKDETKEEMDSGYCHLLGQGDCDLNSSKQWVNTKTGEKNTAENMGMHLSLLWDQVKECYLNLGDEDVTEQFSMEVV
jgi:hypothetical protein